MDVIRSKALYSDFAEKTNTLSAFHQPFWLDATVGPGGWDVVVVEKSNEIVGALPYTVRSRFGSTRLGQPSLSPFLGPWTSPHIREAGDYRSWHRVIESLFDSLPRHDVYSQSWHRSETNWFPLHSQSFSQSTFYSYIVPGSLSAEEAFNRFNKSLKGALKTANRHGLIVETQDNLQTLIRLSRQRFEAKGLPFPYPEKELRAGFAESIKRDKAAVLIAKDPEGSVHAAVLLVWDELSCYYLAGGADSAFASSEAQRFLIAEAIRRALECGIAFDFEGSMVPSIERVFRGFGGVQTPYFHVEKRKGKVQKIANVLRYLGSDAG